MHLTRRVDVLHISVCTMIAQAIDDGREEKKEKKKRK